jgi:hypothetical protein
MNDPTAILLAAVAALCLLVGVMAGVLLALVGLITGAVLAVRIRSGGAVLPMPNLRAALEQLQAKPPADKDKKKADPPPQLKI